MKKLFGSVLGILVMICGLLYFEFFGIYHSFAKHGVKDGLVSVFIPPYSWYRAIEYWWHRDYAGVKWDEKLSADMQSVISVMNLVEDKDPQKQKDIPKAVSELSKRFKDYPSDKLGTLKQGIRIYVEWKESVSSDLNRCLVSFLRDGQGKYEKSQQTLDLSAKASQYPKVKEVMKYIEDGLSRLPEALKKDGFKSVPRDKVEQWSELLRSKSKETSAKMKSIYEGVFNETYPQS